MRTKLVTELLIGLYFLGMLSVAVVPFIGFNQRACLGSVVRLEVNAQVAPRGVNIRNTAAGTIKESLGFKIGQVRFGVRSMVVGTDTWWELCEGGWVAQSVLLVTHLQATSIITPTRITTNTPLPPLVRTQTASQYREEVCWISPEDPAGSLGVCSLFPFGSKFTIRTVQIQP